MTTPGSFVPTADEPWPPPSPPMLRSAYLTGQLRAPAHAGLCPRMAPTTTDLHVAQAVADSHGTRTLQADNTAGPTTTLQAAIDSGHAYFVRPRTELLVIDVDLPADTTQAAARNAPRPAARSGPQTPVPHIVVASGRPGHRHAYLVVGSGKAGF